MKKFSLILQTVRFLRPIQIRYQIWYRIRRIWRKMFKLNYPLSKSCKIYPVVLEQFILKYTSLENNCFTFLNQHTCFKQNNIIWSYKNLGKLWAYNLSYFDFLLQFEMPEKLGEQLIEDFINKLHNNSTALEPYPIALRGINWIKFLSQASPSTKIIFSNSLYAQYEILYDNLEYHLLGNHLLEDGFSLLFGAYYFKDKKLYHKANEILNIELREQILDDGAHFELSPMYHQILLDRLLDCINLIQNNQRFKDQEALLVFMKEKANQMIKWINCMTFSNGQIPLLNDAAPGIAPTTDQLNQYAVRLGIIHKTAIREIRKNPCNLTSSGYRRLNGSNYECIIDIGQIGPSYQPGHAHADTFNFVLNVNNQAYIIDPGISTYEANSVRLEERSTSSHNTVTVNNQNSSEVWSSFRVADRANVTVVKEKDNEIIAIHDGYRKLKMIHQREWEFLEKQIRITDSLIGSITEGKAHFWIAPTLQVKSLSNSIQIEKIDLFFENAREIKTLKVKVPEGYNKYLETYKLEITFNNQLKTTITIN